MKPFFYTFCLTLTLIGPLIAQDGKSAAFNAGAQRSYQGWTAVDLSGSISSDSPSPARGTVTSSTHPANKEVMSAPPSMTITSGVGPAGGYLALSLFGISPIAGVGDETVTNFNVPTFRWAGQTWTRVGVTSNGYVVIGGASTVTSSNSTVPSLTAPLNMLAPFWTNLNPTLGTGGVRIGTLTDGVHTWVVVDWANVRNATSPDSNSFQIWMRVNDIEEVAFSYGHISAGNLGLETIGAQDTTGTLGALWSLNGAIHAPASTTELLVKTRFPINATPNPLGFGNVTVFSPKLDSIVVSNSARFALKVTSCAITGPDMATFGITPDTATIPTGSSKAFHVTCSPTSGGLKNATLSITSNANVLPDSIPLSANGVAPPTIVSVNDLPMDQGGNVVLDWNKSPLDAAVSSTVTSYWVWRGIRAGAASPDGIVLDRKNYSESITRSNVNFREFMTMRNGSGKSALAGDIYWQYMTSSPSHGLAHYSYSSETLADSSPQGIPWRYFFITAATDNPDVYWDSEIDSGYSVDNISPLPPAGLVAVVQPGPHVKLTWDSPSDPDIKSYAVYRSTTNGFTPSPGNTIGTSLATNFTDASPVAGVPIYYRIIATDIHNNISPPSPIAGASVAITQSYSLRDKWNMISVPLTVGDYTKTTLYPTAISNAFAYHGSYVVSGTLTNATGYWVKFNGAQSVPFAGMLRNLDTVDVSTGWNMIGSISTPLGTSNVISIPGGMITTKFFGYAGNYQIVDTIQPGTGYWVKVNQNGKLILSSGSTALPSARIMISPTSELPPKPPDATDSKEESLPTSYSLEQNYPNPFNPATIINYALPASAHVKLSVYNLLGQEVATLIDNEVDAGYKSVTFNGNGLPSGIYTYRLTAGTFTEVKKMTLIK